MKKKRQQLEDYMKEAEQFNRDMKLIEGKITTNNEEFYRLGEEWRNLKPIVL